MSSDDIEKKSLASETTPSTEEITSPSSSANPWYRQATQTLKTYGVETHGVTPVVVEKQTYTSFINLFYFWLSANTGIITVSTGTLGPIVFGLGLRDSCLVILFINAFGLMLPAYFSTMGPTTGMRQMIIARYSFGYIGGAIISAANIVTFMGFLILNAILGGQSLSAASSGGLTPDVGIVIISLISLLITFFGYRFMTNFEKWAWIPIWIVFIIITAIAGKHFQNIPTPAPATAAQVLSFAGTVAGFVISWATLAADYTSYMPPTVSKTKIITYAYLGFMVPTVLLECLGAAFAVTMFAIPSWSDGYDSNGVAGLIAASLEPVGHFGKFLMVVIALGVSTACGPTMYSFGISFQCVAPFFAIVPRYVFSIGSTAILIPLAITGVTHFESTLTDFLSVIGYYAASFAAVVLVEHIVFRNSDGASYDRTHWNRFRSLPTGWAGCLAFALSFALIVPSMDEVWYTGPIAKKGTGDIGFEMGFFGTAVFYYVLRTIDLKYVTKRLGGTSEDSE